ncbi:hypothetical protein Pcinc_026352 [Petrolisthes cinctipes]|uniref:Uncharacterized protein n=1 Tax=Petrolisthes cinctipes TaxID=88211 RepID=A0AAE1F729_PETCI|nr:hypothetical protein Pcinc_026352 [Petrolisthes cinctipes]
MGTHGRKVERWEVAKRRTPSLSEACLGVAKHLRKGKDINSTYSHQQQDPDIDSVGVRAAISLAVEGIGRQPDLIPALLATNNLPIIQILLHLQHPPLPPLRTTPRRHLNLPKPLKWQNCEQREESASKDTSLTHSSSPPVDNEATYEYLKTWHVV